MKRKPNKPQQEPRERPGSWEEPADPGGASSGDAGGGSPGSAGTEGTSGQSVHKSKFRQKSKQEQAAASKLRMEKRGEKLEAARGKLAKQKPPKSRAPSGGWAAPLAEPFTALCMGRFTKTSRKTWASRGPTAPSWWARPPCGMAPGL